MLDMKDMIGIMVGIEVEPWITVKAGGLTQDGRVVNYGEDSILITVPHMDGKGYSLTLFPYANITCIYKYVEGAK